MTAVSTLGERIAHVLRLRKLSASALSQSAGLGRSHVGQLQSGKLGKRPSDETLRRIAEAARVSLRWLATGEGAPDDPAEAPPVVVPKPLEETEGWSDLVATAKRERPDIPAWAFAEVGRWCLVMDRGLSAAMLASLAGSVQSHFPPPRSR